MEHRYARRQVVELRVSLTGAQFQQQPAKIRNISFDGVYVETKGGVLLTGTFVSIDLPPGHAGALRDCRLEALVVHSREAGAGLMFCASGAERRRILSDILADVNGSSEMGC